MASDQVEVMLRCRVCWDVCAKWVSKSVPIPGECPTCMHNDHRKGALDFLADTVSRYPDGSLMLSLPFTPWLRDVQRIPDAIVARTTNPPAPPSDTGTMKRAASSPQPSDYSFKKLKQELDPRQSHDEGRWSHHEQAYRTVPRIVPRSEASRGGYFVQNIYPPPPQSQFFPAQHDISGRSGQPGTAPNFQGMPPSDFHHGRASNAWETSQGDPRFSQFQDTRVTDYYDSSQYGGAILPSVALAREVTSFPHAQIYDNMMAPCSRDLLPPQKVPDHRATLSASRLPIVDLPPPPADPNVAIQVLADLYKTRDEALREQQQQHPPQPQHLSENARRLQSLGAPRHLDRLRSRRHPSGNLSASNAIPLGRSRFAHPRDTSTANIGDAPASKDHLEQHPYSHTGSNGTGDFSYDHAVQTQCPQYAKPNRACSAVPSRTPKAFSNPTAKHTRWGTYLEELILLLEQG